MRGGLVLALAAPLLVGIGCIDESAPTATDEDPPVSPLTAAFGEPIPGIDDEARARFERGRAIALRAFMPSTGLGPTYNAVACASCHEKPVTGGGASRYRGVHVASGATETFTVPFEHHFTVDGISRDAKGTGTGTRIPPPFFGMGLLAEIPNEVILAHADPSDADGDGISGHPNFERGFIGRFGRKAQMASLQGFVRLALLDHLGVTTPGGLKMPYLTEPEGPVELATADGDGVPDPEISAEDLTDLLAFVALLAPPRPDPPTPETRAGFEVFREIGCAKCHVPSLEGPRGPVVAYTDLLLHDMGPELADGVVVGDTLSAASASEFRTQPLWGLAAAGPYLHDGRADTVDAAIRAHGGEGAAAKQRYEALSQEDRDRLLAFLHSLGGSDRKRDGLLVPNAPLLPPGALGGPGRALDAAEAARFTRGRDLFDHDFSMAEGLGPKFNGDACRSCHFAPVLGGAGPADVDVIRHGVLKPDGTFALPASGDTMAPRFDIGGVRPVIDPSANLVERRQTPPLFGLGLIDLIAEETIRANADPDDADGDGIRGVPSVLADGRIGRFGWKAQLATLRDFTVDALAGELGLQAPGELAEEALGDLLFFLAELAPPPSRADDPALAAGKAAFYAMKCASCHVPELPTMDGRPVRLYSDLLLHDVAPKEQRFVVQGTERGFRTPPLWGVAATAPFFHDGLSETLDAAIRRHDGEARASRDAYVGATDAERAALLTFLAGI